MYSFISGFFHTCYVCEDHHCHCVAAVGHLISVCYLIVCMHLVMGLWVLTVGYVLSA